MQKIPITGPLADTVAAFFQKEWHELTELEQRVVMSVIKRLSLARKPQQILDENLTLGERLADKVAAFGGSWTFIFCFACVLAVWVILNSIVLVKSQRVFDPYPYILLNLFLSMIAALQAPVIMMSQNRQAAKDRLAAQHDYEINLRAELEIAHLHAKFDELRSKVVEDLLVMQKEQMDILFQLKTHIGINQQTP